MSQDSLDMNTVMASTVHDVKNSLGLIGSELESFMQTVQGDDPEVAEKLQRVLLETNRINSGLSHMLGVYRIENDLLHPALEEVLVLDVLEDAASRYGSAIENSSIRIDVECESDDMTWVLDPTLVDHILTNIMTNAIRYSHGWIGLKAFVENGQLCIAIDDNGDGYPDGLLHCLEPDASLRVKTSSTGLGIYFANRIAQLHHNPQTQAYGHIELINNPEGGARFALWLP